VVTPRRTRTPIDRQRMLVVACVLQVIMVSSIAISGERGDRTLVVTLAGAAVLCLLVTLRLLVSGRALEGAHLQLIEEHEQLERMFTGSLIGMVLVDSTQRWSRVNPAVCAMLGYAQHELIGRDPADFTHPDDLALTARSLERLHHYDYDGGAIEQRYIAADGSVIWALVTFSATRDPQTREHVHVAQIQDITTRKQAEAAYASERGLLDAFLQNVPEQVYFKDLDSRFLRVSQVQATRLGFDTPAELVGKTDFDVFGDEHARAAFEDEQRMIRTGEPVIDLEERETFDGDAGRPPRTAWVLTTKLPLRDRDGDIVGTFGVSRDITLRKQAEAALSDSEARWRTLLLHLQEVVILVDEHHRLIYATPSVERWLGYAPEELIGVDMTQGVHCDDVAATAAAFDAAAPGHPTTVTNRMRHRDGSWHTLESTLVCLRDDPAVQAVLIASRDVTDHVALEAERSRLELERRVSHRLEAVGQLAAGIAHEINTPLQFVGDSVAFLKEAVEELLILTGRYRELLWIETPLNVGERRSIMREAEELADVEYLCDRIPAAFERTVGGVDRVRSIVQAMKRFSHTTSSDAAPADLNDAIQTTLAVCRNEYKYVAEIALDLGDLPAVTCNVGELNQVFLNLIINSAQAIAEVRSDADELGEIAIATAVDGDQAVLTFTDNGPGMPPEVRERIYEPFFTTKDVGQGTGQGLALARTTIERHGGSLKCDSTPGVGTTFTVRLPLHSAGEDVLRDRGGDIARAA
jgi:two-component system, NtrC family, sensor kinase